MLILNILRLLTALSALSVWWPWHVELWRFLGLCETPCARWCYLTPCDQRLVLGNGATELGGSAEPNCAQHSIRDVRALISLGDWRMDVCQKHLMLPWMKAVGGRDRGRGRVGAVLSSLLLFFMLCSWGFRSEAVAIHQHGKSGWGVQLRRGEGWTDNPTEELILSLSSFFFFLCHVKSTTPALGLEWGSGPEL